MTFSILIISDLHLTNVEEDKIDFFANFCKKYASKADQLFILGDLFNTWIGDDVSLASYKKIIRNSIEAHDKMIRNHKRTFKKSLQGRKKFIRKTPESEELTLDNPGGSIF